jgi:predicted metal-dependent enzyme (double-stranded beta helix superfamily)
MFDLDTFIDDCKRAVRDGEPRLAIKETVSRVLADASVAEALEHSHGDLSALHRSDDLTVLNVVWSPGMVLRPHDHRMWACIGIYAGQEDNAFFRRDHGTITASGGKELRERDVLLLGDDAIHSVTNPLQSCTGAIHVYGGDFFAQPRSQWDPATFAEEPYDIESVLKQFAE